MDYFLNKNGETFCEDLSLESLALEFGTPTYVYSAATLRKHCNEFLKGFGDFPTLACFAVKANSSLAYLKEIFSLGFGADIVSGGELERCLTAGLTPDKIVFSGVGKLDWEIKRALEVGVYSFNVESLEELESINRIATALNRNARVSLRINPNIDARTHPKIATGLHTTKFGLDETVVAQLPNLLRRFTRLTLIGISCHIGSQILDLDPLCQAGERMKFISLQVQKMGFPLEFLGMGGGLGIRYDQETPPLIAQYAAKLMETAKEAGVPRLIVEPGRVIAGNTGILLTRVISVKTTPKKRFIIVDASMSELIRPALYDSFHEILPAKISGSSAQEIFDIVGPVCETSDTLGFERKLVPPKTGDLYYIRSCGAYGSTMASNYNTRPRPAEVFVDGKTARLIKRRETLEDLWALEVF